MKSTDFPPDGIQWHEGMLLQPQHFQQSARRSHLLSWYRTRLASPYPWGVVMLDWDQNRLGGGVLSVVGLEALMPDGITVCRQPGDPELRLDLAQYESELQDGPLTISIGVIRAEVDSSAEPSAQSRYESYESAAVSDLNSADDTIQLPRLRPRLHLLAGEVSDGYTSMPVARVEFRNEAFALTAFEPPRLHLSSVLGPGRLCVELSQKVRQRARLLDDRQQHLSLANDHEIAERVRRQIETMMMGLPQLEALLGSGRGSPFDIYLGMCGLLGPLASLISGQIPPIPPAYTHADLQGCFSELIGTLESMLHRGTNEQFQGYPFTLTDDRFERALRPEWLSGAVLLSVQPRRGVSERDAMAWVESALMGTESRLEAMRNRRLRGVTRRRIDRYKDFVPTGDNLLYELTETERHIVPSEALVCFNPEAHHVLARPVALVLYVERED
ncbi:MAG: type VI secretion system protein ImpJ [Myxococcota bacterium]